MSGRPRKIFDERTIINVRMESTLLKEIDDYVRERKAQGGYTRTDFMHDAARAFLAAQKSNISAPPPAATGEGGVSWINHLKDTLLKLFRALKTRFDSAPTGE